MDFRDLLLVFLLHGTALSKDDTMISNDIKQYVKEKGYSLEEHRIQTEDGYLLTYHRIQPKTSPETEDSKYPVLLQHSLITSSADFLVPDNNALAYVLVDGGFDVWLGNSRGNQYSRGHVKLSPEDSEFWNFGVEDMALDVAAGMDYILNTTEESKVLYVGHSHGAMYPLMISGPENQNMVAALVALAPAVYLTGVSNSTQDTKLFLESISQLVDDTNDKNKIFMDGPALTTSLCSSIEKINKSASCDGVLNNLRGNIIQKALDDVQRLHPFGTSKTALQYIKQQIDRGDVFARPAPVNTKDEGNRTEYNLTGIPFPVHIFLSDHDVLVTRKDVDLLKNSLKISVLHEIQNENFNHIDFVWGKDAMTLVFKPVLEVLNNVEKLEVRRLRKGKKTRRSYSKSSFHSQHSSSSSSSFNHHSASHTSSHHSSGISKNKTHHSTTVNSFYKKIYRNHSNSNYYDDIFGSKLDERFQKSIKGKQQFDNLHRKTSGHKQIKQSSEQSSKYVSEVDGGSDDAAQNSLGSKSKVDSEHDSQNTKYSKDTEDQRDVKKRKSNRNDSGGTYESNNYDSESKIEQETKYYFPNKIKSNNTSRNHKRQFPNTEISQETFVNPGQNDILKPEFELSDESVGRHPLNPKVTPSLGKNHPLHTSITNNNEQGLRKPPNKPIEHLPNNQYGKYPLHQGTATDLKGKHLRTPPFYNGIGESINKGDVDITHNKPIGYLPSDNFESEGDIDNNQKQPIGYLHGKYPLNPATVTDVGEKYTNNPHFTKNAEGVLSDRYDEETSSQQSDSIPKEYFEQYPFKPDTPPKGRKKHLKIPHTTNDSGENENGVDIENPSRLSFENLPEDKFGRNTPSYPNYPSSSNSDEEPSPGVNRKGTLREPLQDLPLQPSGEQPGILGKSHQENHPTAKTTGGLPKKPHDSPSKEDIKPNNNDLEILLRATRRHKKYIKDAHNISFDGSNSDIQKIPVLDSILTDLNEDCIGECKKVRDLMKNFRNVIHQIKQSYPLDSEFTKNGTDHLEKGVNDLLNIIDQNKRHIKNVSGINFNRNDNEDIILNKVIKLLNILRISKDKSSLIEKLKNNDWLKNQLFHKIRNDNFKQNINPSTGFEYRKLLNELKKYDEFLKYHGINFKNDESEESFIKKLTKIDNLIDSNEDKCSGVCKDVKYLIHNDGWFRKRVNMKYFLRKIKEKINKRLKNKAKPAKNSFQIIVNVLLTYKEYFACIYNVNIKEKKSEDYYIKNLFLILSLMDEEDSCNEICQLIRKSLNRNKWFNRKIKIQLNKL